jgi:hypothetical protein
MKREPVVGRNKIDARCRPAVISTIKIRAASEPVGEGAEFNCFSTPEVADLVTELVIPFSPAYGKLPDHITFISDVPGFGDELYLRDNRILMYDIEKRT